MKEGYLNLLIKEFGETVQHWTSLGLSTVNRNHDLTLRNSERDFNLILNMSTLSIAFLDIVLPLIKDFPLVEMAKVIIICFLFASVIGITILLITINRDNKHIQSDYEWEYALIKRYLSQAVDIESDLNEYAINNSPELLLKITDKVNKYFEEKKELKAGADQRKNNKEKEFSFILLRCLKPFFWTTFSIATLLLTYSLLIKLSQT